MSKNPNQKTSVNVIGSNVIAQNNLDINTYDLNVQASQNTNSQTQDSKNVNGSISFTMYGGGGGTAGLGYGQNNSSSDRVINNNSVLKANNMSIKTSNDAVFKGATVNAKNLDLNVSNNLLVESLRDTYNSKSDGYNLNGGLGFGSAGAQTNRIPSLDVAGTSSTNAGYSVNNGMTVNKQTVLSSITANNLTVNVGNNTHIKGALVASGEFDKNGKFEDNKNLNFSTNTLTFENMSNSSYSSNQSVGGNLNVNQDSTKIVNQKEEPQQSGISNVKYQASNSLDVNANKTLATLGQGNINVKDTANSSNLDLLNQDTTKINKDLYSSNVSSKVDATLDTRLLTEDGRKQIAEDMERTKRLGQSIGDVLTSDAFKITDTFNHIDDVKKDLDVQKALSLKNDGKTVDIIENQNKYSQTQIDMAINDYAQIYASTYGVNIEDVKMALLNKYGSTYTNEDNTSSNIYVDKILNQNALLTANNLGHEVAHVRQNQGQTYLRATTQLQEEYSDIFGNYSADGLEFSSYTYNNVQLNTVPTNNLNLTNQDVNTLKTNTNLYLQDEIKADNGDGKIDNLCINSMDCYGNKTLSDFKKTVSLKTEDNLGNYNLINQINPDTKNVEFYSLYNEKTGNNINLKPQELENLKQMAQTDPEKFNNLMAVYEMQSNTTHTVYNAVSGLYDTGYTDGIIDANSRYLQNGEFVLDFLPVGIASKFVGTSSKLSTKVVDDVGLNNGVDFYATKNGIIPSIGYRALGDGATQRALNGEGIMSSKDTYFTFDNLANKSSQEIQSILQLDPRNIPSSYAQFNTFQIIDDIKIPYGQWNNASYLEPITKDYPRFGTGGATQVITNTPIDKYIIKEIK